MRVAPVAFMRQTMLATRRGPLAVLLLTGTFSVSACGGEEDRGATPPGNGDAAAAQAVTDTTDQIYIAERETSAEPPPTIYYDLTRHDWYARGEPLVHEGRAYVAGGALVAAETSAMRPLGEYGGVSYYQREGESAETLFVPVYERYWMQFRAQGTPPTP
jgi:hypothetical protein